MTDMNEGVKLWSEIRLWAEMKQAGLPSAEDLDAWVNKMAEEDRAREATACRGPEGR